MTDPKTIRQTSRDSSNSNVSTLATRWVIRVLAPSDNAAKNPIVKMKAQRIKRVDLLGFRSNFKGKSAFTLSTTFMKIARKSIQKDSFLRARYFYKIDTHKQDWNL